MGAAMQGYIPIFIPLLFVLVSLVDGISFMLFLTRVNFMERSIPYAYQNFKKGTSHFPSLAMYISLMTQVVAMTF